MVDKEECNTGLVLGLGGGRDVVSEHNVTRETQKPTTARVDFSFSLSPKVEAVIIDKTNNEEDMTKKMIKNKIKDNDDDNGGRKKLRLTKDQSKLLEDTFRFHSTLNMVQKQELAEKLNLKPRQVEVWFQNRRARTKLKQTERECEFLRKYCDNLRDENKRLKREKQELLQSSCPSKDTTSAQLHIQPPPKSSAAAVMCQSCGKITSSSATTTTTTSAACKVNQRDLNYHS